MAGFDLPIPGGFWVPPDSLYRGKICFRPTLDHQHILPRGTPEEVRAHVEHMFSALSHSDGGFVGSASIHLDMPLANVEAMLDAIASLRYQH